MLRICLPKVGIKLYIKKDFRMLLLVSLLFVCGSDQSLFLFKFKIFVLNTSIYQLHIDTILLMYVITLYFCISSDIQIL